MSLHRLPRVHTGPFVDLNVHDDGYAHEFLAGYQAGRAWFAEGAYVSEAEELADIHWNHTRGGPDYEVGASLYLDADKFPSLLVSMGARDGACERKFGPRFPVKDGRELTAEFVEDYGGTAEEWAFPARAFLLAPTRPFDDGLLTAVAHILGRV